MNRLPAPSEVVRISPFQEEAEVYFCEQRDNTITIGVIFRDSKRAERFILSPEEFAERVSVLPQLSESFAERALRVREPFLLYVDAVRMRLAHTFDPHYAVSVTQVDLLPHQVDAVYQHMLPLPRVRFLLADDPGLGKTIMAGLLLKELKSRGTVRYILLVVPAHLQDQWRRELRDWFREEFATVDRNLVHSLTSDDFFQRNPQLITSLDFAKQEPYRDQLARRRWDLVIFDEAHKLSVRRYGTKEDPTRRYLLARAIAPATTHLLFLTATPHSGDDYDYFRRIDLLEPRLFASEEAMKKTASSGGLPIVLRRTKEQVTDLRGQKLFLPRHVESISTSFSDAERLLYQAVTDYVRSWYSRVVDSRDKRSRNIALALTTLQRRVASSVTAIRESLIRRRSRLRTALERWERAWLDQDADSWDEESLEEEWDATESDRERIEQEREGLTAARTPDELRSEIHEVERLIRLAERAGSDGSEAKVEEVRKVVDRNLKGAPDEKLLVFTEFKDTLGGLVQRFRQWGYDVAVIHGGLSLEERIEQERRFRDEVQVMVATDAAGEGLNLQFCRLMINYDLPWNPNRLEQRMGRIHRYGQTREVFIYNLLYPETVEGKVLGTLMDKLDRMRARLGDTVFDVVGELLQGVRLEERIMQALLQGDTQEIEAFISQYSEEALENYRRTLEENALAGHHIDLAAVLKDDAVSREMRLVPWDVERFTRLAASILGGTVEADKRQDSLYRIAIPREFARKHHLPESHVRGLRVAFKRDLARKARPQAEFLAPGHKLMEALIDHFTAVPERPVKALLVDRKGWDGSLWMYRGRVVDGDGHPALERLLTLFWDRRTGHISAVDPRAVWEMESPEPDAQVPEGYLKSLAPAEEMVSREASSQMDAIFREAQERRSRERQIKLDYLTHSYEALIRESNAKLIDYMAREEKGEDVRLAKSEEERNLRRLLEDQRASLERLEREASLTRLEPELMAVALVVPPGVLKPAQPEEPPEDLKRQIEVAGMKVVMEYERSQGRDPVNVSSRRLGYDIISRGREETRRIEVKSFHTTGPLQLTLHNEWEMAMRYHDALVQAQEQGYELEDKLYIYVVENALTDPKITIIEDPAGRLASSEDWKRDVRIVISSWKWAGRPA